MRPLVIVGTCKELHKCARLLDRFGYIYLSIAGYLRVTITMEASLYSTVRESLGFQHAICTQI
jgi:hypothetical protein